MSYHDITCPFDGPNLPLTPSSRRFYGVFVGILDILELFLPDLSEIRF